MTRHKFHAQGKKKVYTSTASSSLQQVFSDDSVDDFSDNETPPLAPTYKRRKGFRSDGNVASLDSKDDLAVQRVKVRQAVEFLESCWNGGNKKLLVICGPPGSGKTTLVETVAKEMGCSLIRWNKILFGKADNKETQLLDSYSVWRENTFPNESVDELMVSCRYQALATEEYSSARSVIVVDENIVSKRDNRKMEQIGTELEWIAQQTIYPTIIIITYEFAASSVAKLLEKRISASNIIHWLSIHAVTKTEMHKALSRYCRMHNIAMPEKADCELIVEQCRGDLRWAIAQVQLCWSSQVGSERILVDDIRDASFDMCRAIGKIFYNKRRQDGKPKDSIWSIVSSVDESAEKWIGYLIQNCYQFYTDIGDLSELLYTLCEAHEIANWYSSWLDREMAQQCAQMVAGEAARHYNRRPSHRGFQPIHGDIYWSVPSEIAKVVETWSEKRDLVDDIRDKVYYRDIVPCFKITQILDTNQTNCWEETNDAIDNISEDN